jgi:sucrose-phosphate synthase
MYILMVNIHGLVRQDNIEFGRDADTGGQTRYVVDLVKQLSKHPDVDRVDLVTRQIRDKRVSAVYSKKEEPINEKASIIRLPCGGNKYIPKEKLWPHLDEYSDKLTEYLQKQDRLPDIVHGHYADAGYVGSQIASIFGIPFVFSGHSLGRNKLNYLNSYGVSYKEAVRRFKIDTRIEHEERVLSQADMVIASTEYERDEIYGAYDNRNLEKFAVIPPGLDLELFFPYYEYEMPGNTISEVQRQAHHRLLTELRRFHFEPEKPLILTLCRPDSRKNIDLLIEVYGQDKELQALANLAVFAGIRDNITEMEEEERQVLTDILLLMDQYDLYGKMAIPKNHDPSTDVPELYRIAALKRGVFISTASLENFGLTFIEASASGLPFVATHAGGPVDIERNCKSGKLVDISKKKAISKALRELLTDPKIWEEYSENGINNTRKIYTWEKHVESYMEKLQKLRSTDNEHMYAVEKKFHAIGKRMARVASMLIVDIDDTLLGNDEAVERLSEYLGGHKDHLAFGVATGRGIHSALDVLSKCNLPYLDVIISSVGSEIHYAEVDQYDQGWDTHISRNWKPRKIREVMKGLDYVELQSAEETQGAFKVSYFLKDGYDPDHYIPLIHNALSDQRLSYHLIFSHGSYIDILPYRAGKGKAIRYLAHKWNVPAKKIITAGNSGNDADMLTGMLNGIVVGNHNEELKRLEKSSRVYFSPYDYADGILDGLKHYEKVLKL